MIELRGHHLRFVLDRDKDDYYSLQRRLIKVSKDRQLIVNKIGWYLDALISSLIIGPTEASYRSRAMSTYTVKAIEKITDFLRKLRKMPLETQIRVTAKTDDICRLCSSNDKCSKYEPNMPRLLDFSDRRVIRSYGMKVGDIITLGELYNKLATKKAN